MNISSTSFRVLSIRVLGTISPSISEQLRSAAAADSPLDALVIDLVEARDHNLFVRRLLFEVSAHAAGPALRVITKDHGNVVIHSSSDSQATVLEHLPRPSPTVIEGVQWDEIVLPVARTAK